MKIYFLLLFTLLFSVSAFAQSKTFEQLKSQAKTFKKSGKYKISYNKSRDKTIVQTEDSLVECMNFSVAFNFDGKELKQSPGEVVFIFTLSPYGNSNCSESWKGYKELELVLYANGRQVWYGDSDRDETFANKLLGQASFQDQLFYRVPISVLEKLRSAKKINFSVNTDSGTFTKGIIEMLDNFYRLTQINDN